MTDFCYWLFNMSIVASITAAVILLLRPVRKIPRRVITILWLIPFLRAVIPVGVGSKFSLMSWLSGFATKTVVIHRTRVHNLPQWLYSQTNCVQMASGYYPVTLKTNLLEEVFEAASAVWAMVTLALIIALAIVCFATVRELRDAEHLYDNVYCSPKVSTPAVYGVFRPRIILPTSLKDSERLDKVLLHERCHIRRWDNFWRVIAILTAVIHWFNPLAWVCLKLYLSDAETACDEKALSGLTDEGRTEYAHALLDVQESRTVFASAFGGAKLRTRIERIVSFKKMTVFSAVGFGVLVAFIAFVLLTNAA